MTSPLSNSKKLSYLPILIKRQNGLNCYQCGIKFSDNDYIYEHLNDNRFDNRLENIALCCQSCNVKKINDIDMKLKATEILRRNEDAAVVEFDGAIESKSSEMEVNRLLRPFCKQYITERVNTDGNISLRDVILELTYLSQEKFGCGADSTIRKYLAELTCKVSPFMIIKEGKDRLIVKRRGNWWQLSAEIFVLD